MVLNQTTETTFNKSTEAKPIQKDTDQCWESGSKCLQTLNRHRHWLRFARHTRSWLWIGISKHARNAIHRKRESKHREQYTKINGKRWFYYFPLHLLLFFRPNVYIFRTNCREQSHHFWTITMSIEPSLSGKIQMLYRRSSQKSQWANTSKSIPANRMERPQMVQATTKTRTNRTAVPSERLTPKTRSDLVSQNWPDSVSKSNENCYNFNSLHHIYSLSINLALI